MCRYFELRRVLQCFTGKVVDFMALTIDMGLRGDGKRSRAWKCPESIRGSTNRPECKNITIISEMTWMNSGRFTVGIL